MKSIIIVGILLVLIPVSFCVAQLPGDFNCNGTVNMVDLTYLVNQLHSGLIDTESCTWQNGDLNSDSLCHTIADWQQFCIYFYPNPPNDIPPQPNQLDSIIVTNALALPAETVWLPIQVFAADSLRAFMIQLRFDQSFLLEPTARNYLNPDAIVSQLRNGDTFYWYYFDFAPIIFGPGLNHIGDIGFVVSDSVPLDTTLELELIGGDYYPSGLANNSYPTYFIRPFLINGYIHIGPSEIGEGPVPNKYEFKLANYPNPFNSSTQIAFKLAEQARVEINIYDIVGRKVSQLYNGRLQAGYQCFNWNADHMPSGIYFYRLMTNRDSFTNRMILLK